MNANNGELKDYYHYDSNFYLADSATPLMKLSLPSEGRYEIKLANIFVAYAGGYTPQPFAGFLCLSGLSIDQSGSVKISPIVGRSRKILFPMRDPTSGVVEASIANVVQLEKDDQFRLSFLDNTGVEVATDRIICTLLITVSH